MFENEHTNVPDFSGIPALGDVNGLEQYLNNETLAAQGLNVQTNSTSETPTADATQTAAPTTPTTTTQDTITLTKEQLNAILASRGVAQPQPQAQPQQTQTQPRTAPSQQGAGYTQQEQAFIGKALAQGYSLTQINDFLVKQKGNAIGVSPELEQRIAQVEQYLKTQEYKALENDFVSRLSDFGTRFGLSEQDLVTFGNEALKHGINIAAGNVNFETVFRAIYPDQYAIRTRRMAPTTASQIYGGNSMQEGSRIQSSKLEDAYVESFLKGTMPNQYAALNKK